MPTQLPITEIKNKMMKFARKELVFGCEVVNETGNKDIILFGWGDKSMKYREEFRTIGSAKISRGDIKEIIGSPLLLSDVLQPVCDNLKELYDTTTVYWGCENGVFEFIKGAGDYDEEDEVVFEWKLSTPYFNDLPEETQRKIHAILFPNQE